MFKLFGKIGLCSVMVFSSFLAMNSAFATAQGSDIRAWQGKLIQLIAKKQVYPRAAMRKELEGRAKVRVSIDRDGKILSHSIVTPTGYDVFDSEIPKLMERINPLPAPPSALGDDQLSFVLPLSWVIQ